MSACGEAPPQLIVSWTPSDGAGVAVRLVSSAWVDETHPWEQPPAGFSCLHYVIEATSIDGARHELRAEQFQAAGAAPAPAAVGRCNAPQIEPTWIGTQRVDLSLVFLAPAGGVIPHLYWRP
jgi:hypothetical protein